MKGMTVIGCTIVVILTLIACSVADPIATKPASQAVTRDPNVPKPIAIDTDQKRLIVVRRAVEHMIVLDRILSSGQITIAGISHTLPDDLLAQLRQRLVELRDDCITLMGGVGRMKAEG